MAKSRRTQTVPGEEGRKRPGRIRSDPRSVLRHVRRAAVMLRLGDGLTLSRTMRAAGLSKPTVRRWRDRFPVDGVDGLLRGIPRRRGRKTISGDRAGGLTAPAMPPPERAGPTVSGILKRNGPKLRRARTFRVSRGPRSGLEVHGAAGLHPSPPGHAAAIPADGNGRVNAIGSDERANADPGAGADAGAPAGEARPSRDPRPRLQAERRRLPDGGP